MSIFERKTDPYENYASLGGALFLLKLMENPFGGEDERLGKELFNLMHGPWWLRPIDFVIWRFKKVSISSIRNPKGQCNYKVLLRKAPQLFEDERKDIIKWEFKVGNYPIFGYVIPRTPNDIRQPVPQNIWGDGAKIDWENNSVQNGSLAFEGVKVVDIDNGDDMGILKDILKGNTPQNVPLKRNASAPPRPNPPAKRGRGQPTKIKAIEKAYNSLNMTDELDFSRTLNFNFPRISDKTIELTPSCATELGKGPDIKTIRKAVGKQFKADQKLFLKGQASVNTKEH
ncbi:MAG: hypothetical protein WC521_05835 [Bdellovibrionales bacterium]